MSVTDIVNVEFFILLLDLLSKEERKMQGEQKTKIIKNIHAHL
jgi:hypothetical protein